MSISKIDQEMLELWMEDETFINWAFQQEAKDVAKWESYFNQHPEHWHLGKIGKTIVVGIPFREIRQDDIQSASAHDALMAKLDAKPQNRAIQPVLKGRRFLGSWYSAAAIAALIIVSCGFAYLQLRNTEVIYHTQFGEQRILELPDESLVTLNANSELKYFTSNPRKVWLDGEAFFEVKKMSETNERFLVFTPDLTVTVLGTSFNVNTRNDQTKVFLEEGKVKLAMADAKHVDMAPGDLITYSKRKKRVKEKKNNASVLENASWKDGTLIFNNTPLIKAIYEIEDIYGIQFVWQSEKLKKKLISGGVPIKDLNTTLHILKEVYKNEITKEGNRYLITEKTE